MVDILFLNMSKEYNEQMEYNTLGWVFIGNGCGPCNFLKKLYQMIIGTLWDYCEVMDARASP